jgi:hypothetical protein
MGVMARPKFSHSPRRPAPHAPPCAPWGSTGHGTLLELDEAGGYAAVVVWLDLWVGMACAHHHHRHRCGAVEAMQGSEGCGGIHSGAPPLLTLGGTRPAAPPRSPRASRPTGGARGQAALPLLGQAG